MYAIEMVQEKKTTGTAVVLQPVEPEAESQGEGVQGFPMVLYFGNKLLKPTDKPLEDVMQEESGPDLPECQGGAG